MLQSASHEAGQSHKLTNWMGNITTTPKAYVEASSIEDVQAVVKDVQQYPTPVRAGGARLSPSAIHSNDGGTTIGMHRMTKVLGFRDLEGPDPGSTVKCIEAEAGVTLAALQDYLHEYGLEMAFSPEIGSATLGGVCFCTTKDSAIGPVCPSGNLGDFRNGLMSITIVNARGEVEEVRLFDAEGRKSERFQSLLTSHGTQGIAVRLCVATRPGTSVQTSIFCQGFSSTQQASDFVFEKHAAATAQGGNVFSTLHTNGVLYLEYRTPCCHGCAPLSRLVRNILEPLKCLLFMICLMPSFCKCFQCISGSWVLRHWNLRRRSGFVYPQQTPVPGRRLTFTYVSFDFGEWSELVAPGLEWAAAYKEKTGFTPDGFAIYFTTQNDHTIAPHGGDNDGAVFSFDPIYHDPLDERWVSFCTKFCSWAREKGGFPGLNQTIQIEEQPEWGATVVSGTPEPRFLSDWLRPFFAARAAGRV